MCFLWQDVDDILETMHRHTDDPSIYTLLIGSRSMLELSRTFCTASTDSVAILAAEALEAPPAVSMSSRHRECWQYEGTILLPLLMLALFWVAILLFTCLSSSK